MFIFVSTILFEGAAGEAGRPVVASLPDHPGRGVNRGPCVLCRLGGSGGFCPRGGSADLCVCFRLRERLRFCAILEAYRVSVGKTRLCSGLYKCTLSCQPKSRGEVDNNWSTPTRERGGRCICFQKFMSGPRRRVFWIRIGRRASGAPVDFLYHSSIYLRKYSCI